MAALLAALKLFLEESRRFIFHGILAEQVQALHQAPPLCGRSDAFFQLNIRDSGVAAEQVGRLHGAEGGFVPRHPGTFLHLEGSRLLPAYWVKGNPCRTSAPPMEMQGFQVMQHATAVSASRGQKHSSHYGPFSPPWISKSLNKIVLRKSIFFAILTNCHYFFGDI